METKPSQYKAWCIPCNKSIDSATPETICPRCKRHLSCHINPLGIQHDERIMKPDPKPIYKQPTEFTYAICPQDKYSKGFTHETKVREAVIFDRHYKANPDILNPKTKEQPKPKQENALGGMALLILCAILIIKFFPMIPAVIIAIAIIIGLPLLLIVLPLLFLVYAASMANDVANIAKIINKHKNR
jgi:hypothetical protein